MAKWIAAYNEEDVPYGDEIRIRIEGVETGFVAVPENGEDLGLYPVDTEEEAREDLAYIMASFSTSSVKMEIWLWFSG